MPFLPVRVPAHNPGPLTGEGNQTYLIVGDAGIAALIDAGQGRSEHLRALDAALQAAHAHLALVLVTHAHSDHIEGVAALAAAHPRALFLKKPWPGRDERFPVPWQPLEDQQVVDVGGEALVAIHTPGHAPDHLTFWHASSRTAFVGDLVLRRGTVMIPTRGGDLAAYLASVERVRGLSPARLLPAHGDPIERPDRTLVRTIEQRLTRERHLIEALKAGPATVQALVESIYDGLDSALLPAATETIRAHLDKLRREGRVLEANGRWSVGP